MMTKLSLEEMTSISGGKDAACAIAAAGMAAAEMGLILGVATGGLSLGLAVIGVAASLYGVMNSCS